MDNFQAHTKNIRKEMLDKLQLEDINQLFSCIDTHLKMETLNLPESLSELRVDNLIRSCAKKNNTDYLNFIGAGAYNRFIPACISQINSRFEFNTAYTPYQAEISQGTLQAIYEYQSMMCNLTDMDVSNASVYDGATAVAEALIMACKITKKNKCLISSTINPEIKAVLKTYSFAHDVEIEYINQINFQTDYQELYSKLNTQEYACIIIQYPNFYGTLEKDILSLKQILENKKTLLIVYADLISLSILKPPKADIIVGSLQPLGNSLSFGGPYAGYMVTLDKYKRNLPGRIVGRTLDAEGNQAFCLTLQAREQHIRREKATSNICSNQSLCTVNSLVYLSVLGKEGLNQVAGLSFNYAHKLASLLQSIGFKVLNDSFFNEFVLQVINVDNFIQYMNNNNILPGVKLDNDKILVCTTELNDSDQIQEYFRKAKEFLLINAS